MSGKRIAIAVVTGLAFFMTLARVCAQRPPLPGAPLQGGPLKLLPATQMILLDPEPVAGISAVAAAPDAKTLAVAGVHLTKTRATCEIKLWDVATGKEKAAFSERSTSEIRSLTYSPDGKTLLSQSKVGDIKAWDVATGKARCSVRGPGSSGPLHLSPDGMALALATTSGAKIYELDRGTARATLQLAAGSTLRELKFFPDGKKLAGIVVKPRRTGQVFEVVVWDAATGKATEPLMKETAIGAVGGTINSLAFSPNGKTLAVVAAIVEADRRAGYVKLIETATNKDMTTLTHTSQVDGVAFSADSQIMLSTIRQVDKTKKPAGQIRLWDAEGKPRATLEGFSAPIQTTVFTPDGKALAALDEDGNLKAWNVDTGKELLNHHAGVAGLLDDRLPQPPRAVPPSALPGVFDHRVVIAPDGKALAAATRRGEVHLWVVGPRTEESLLEHMIGAAWWQFAADGKSFTTFDGRAFRSWDIPPKKPAPATK